MTIVKTSAGRFTAKLKRGRQFVTSRTFDTKREAKAWLSRERAALEGGVDPRAGRQRMGTLLEEWLAVRRVTVATKTFRVDQSLLRLVPTGMQAINIAAVSRREVARSFDQLLGSGLSERSVVRYRASLSSFFSWCVRERLIASNPVTGVPVPRSTEEQVEMRPWTEDALEAAHRRWQQEDVRLADVLPPRVDRPLLGRGPRPTGGGPGGGADPGAAGPPVRTRGRRHQGDQGPAFPPGATCQPRPPDRPGAG